LFFYRFSCFVYALRFFDSANPPNPSSKSVTGSGGINCGLDSGILAGDEEVGGKSRWTEKETDGREGKSDEAGGFCRINMANNKAPPYVSRNII
jgi:hypothetical protein